MGWAAEFFVAARETLRFGRARQKGVLREVLALF
jgi:hypothetical protein